MTYRGVAKVKTIELDEALPFVNGQLVSVEIERSTERLHRARLHSF